MKTTKKQQAEIDRLTHAGYRVVRQMDSRDADWKEQTPDVILIEETTAAHRITVEVDANGNSR